MIIGITGTLGAGKSTIVKFLVSKGFKDHSVRNFLINELKKKGIKINRDNLVEIANQLRAENSPSYIVEQIYEASKKEKNIIIESIRTPGEVEALRQKGNFMLLAVDAEQHHRYNRIIKRGSETDKVSFKKFKEDEKKEFSNTDPNKQNLKKCIALADHKFENNETLQELKHKIEKWITSKLG